MHSAIRGHGWIIPFIAAALTFCSAIACFGAGIPKEQDDSARADLLTLDRLKAFGRLERPAVVFAHQKHTEALEKKGKTCSACHLALPDKPDRFGLLFKRLKDESRQHVMDLYHDQCIACHRQTRKAGEVSGPVECGMCHQPRPTRVSSWQPIGMDKSLHYRHTKAQAGKCEACHHEFDAKTKKLFYTKGQEATCRYCHREKTEENRIDMRSAAHLDCINCHRLTLAKQKTAGPVKCSGCHDAAQQLLIAKADPLPRLERKQPDTVFIKIGPVEPAPDQAQTRMARVAFNHQRHEQSNDTCRVCHHESLNACSKCHTPAGSADGKNVKLEQAFHQVKSDHSCIGCHDRRQKDKNCAGCHGFLTQSRPKDLNGCRLCHAQTQPVSAQAAAPVGEAAHPTDPAAEALLASRPIVTPQFTDEEVPEKVKIKHIAAKYEPAEMPHRKIVAALLKGVGNSKMAGYFHNDRTSICQGCHHNSPGSLKPPSCASCHGKPFDPRQADRPGLMAAYHRQCMECHQAMGIKRPDSRDCSGCHLEKKAL